ncbi:mechanosensitive ion channel family protein [Metabacillus hrfriensis]|uniref:Mechanosensitive ion channel family protein n=1 Tax=Metabacillus hrfriensis TaxID=3048891 RepID=A0ACD4RBL4_9BACI|nr:mechanosensitive ion channel family protein [Metabacillus sp. CT-WN-B3]UOK58064.1 mechanosensitive ion channel family protein [Bacillus sp. OVS6]USK28624.1 mechanosensitive ion channel family protein [Bacillus sp. CMF21]WHZ57841.1 mechanosensitive ion channel family protein [Metabacillus sp. CT-WN-B3]
MDFINKLIDKIGASLLNEDLWLNFGQGLLKIIGIMILSTILIRVGNVVIGKIFLLRTKSPLRISERRENTLVKLLDNILTYLVYFVALLMILETLSFDVKALLAGAGIVGLAVGFGAQNLVRDIITGFFIIFEDQFSVGDMIRVGQFEGTVEEIGLRTTKIKSWTGEINILPNGNITEVTNFSVNNSVAFVDVSIAYEGDIPKAERVIEDLLLELPDKYEEMVAPPELLGVQNLGPSGVVLRVVSEVLPMKHFHISRVLRKEIKMRLDEHGIEIPYPRMVMYTRQDEGAKQKERMSE